MNSMGFSAVKFRQYFVHLDDDSSVENGETQFSDARQKQTGGGGRRDKLNDDCGVEKLGTSHHRHQQGPTSQAEGF